MSAPKQESQIFNETELQELVDATDNGARKPAGYQRALLLSTALCWSLFQLWIASPLPFYDWPLIGSFGVFNDTEARSIHLAFAVFLSFIAYPAFAKSPRNRVPTFDLVMALAGAFSAAYLFIFYESLSSRPGAPIIGDLVVASLGCVMLLEATRRSLGLPLVIVALAFLVYTFAGPYMPEIIAHKGASLAEVVNHQWITTEGVFGIALGVSTSFVFLFVLFGALLEKAGAGNYFIKVAFSLLGHMRGGPAKAAVVSSGMTGLISGSSIANVVTTGTFTVPMMKRVGFSAEKAGAVEVASSVNGQIMPPVMGAAAFLMVEYVGLPYVEVITHAFLPALISYIALVYIVHLEALKQDMKGLPRRKPVKPWLIRLTSTLFGFLVTAAAAFAVYYGIGWIKPVLGETASLAVAGLVFIFYVGLVWFSARYPDLELDDPDSKVLELPEAATTIMSGLHYLLPVVVLVWCLMVERLSPGLSAFWANVMMAAILVTQRPLFAFFRGRGSFSAEFRLGVAQLLDGLITGARNMIGIGIATATAGIIVGAVSQTGVGSVLADLVEALSFGNLLLMLLLTAVLSLILGMGLPTTANYIVVSSLLAPVIITLGQESGLIVPLIAVHLFVFYFGIMADVTPPVGLASFAAAAVSGGNPIRTGCVAFFYSLRTAILPFLFIFNTDLLLIGVDWWHGVAVFVASTIGILLFTAATQGYFVARNRIHETLLMLVIAFALFRPGFWMDLIVEPFELKDGTVLIDGSVDIPSRSQVRLRIAGEDEVGNPREFFALLTLGQGDNTHQRLIDSGIELLNIDGRVLVDVVRFDSAAERSGLRFDQTIQWVEVPQNQPPKELVFIPALLLLAPLTLGQRRRIRAAVPQKVARA